MKKKSQVEEKPKTLWHTLSADDCLEKLNSNQNGLSGDEATKRQNEFGKNTLPQKKPTSIIVMFLKELINPIVIILLFAMAFSFVVGELLDGLVILGIVMIDAVIGAVQSKRAERIASSLSGMIKVKAKVLRDGAKQEVDSVDLVPGDIVFLESGDKISADMRILTCSNFTVDEALLTGESINAVKDENSVDAKASLGDRACMVFSGSSVITGRATCVVAEIGNGTQIGNIATNLNEVKDEKSPLTIRINKFSKQISIGIVAIAVIIFLIMLVQGNPFKDIFLCVIALAVSAMPEGLPLAVTMALTIASNRMSKNNVVVKNLNAVESLGSCTVIATDKTGTLTLNEQTAKIIVTPDQKEFEVTGSGYNDNGEVVCEASDKEKLKYLASLGMLNTEAEFKREGEKFKYFGDSIDIAFKVLGAKMQASLNDFKIVSRIPYESENKYSAVFFEQNGKNYVTVKGSVEKLLELSTHMQDGNKKQKLDTQKILAQNESLAKRGYRIIAVAVGEINSKQKYDENDLAGLTLLGLVGFIDPVRLESKSAIADCHRAGIKVIMITGDHPLTAYSIAQDINIAKDFSCVATGKEVEEAFLKGEQYFDEFVKGKTVFSRVTPTDKLNIVNSLKRMGEFVAVTGDGVNDSPAIKSAHIGIAMGSGTDVSKETADMIIIDDNFNSIVQGVKEGRNAYANIRKITYFLLSCSIAEVLFFVLALVCGAGTPLLAIQLLWLNVVTDGFQDLSLSLEKPEDGIMDEKPRPTTESLFSKSMVSQCLVIGATIGLTIFGTWMILLNVFNFDLVVARSLVMALMVFMQNLHAFNCRSEHQSIFKQKLNNWFFVVSVVASVGLQILFMEVPLLSQFLDLTTVPYTTLLILVAVSFVVILVSEIYKAILRRKSKKCCE
ncbi:MAG: HAD-IC family P-type ATPase [Clostridia bacterium]|nr:HAD-IC family P-type ATPase [Clostridia bacterium]